MSDVLLVVTNLPDRATAERIADMLVTEGMAACINILAPCTSVYRWEDKLNHTDEVPLLIKTTRAAYTRLQNRLQELHPYELPELIAVPVTNGLPAYLAWVGQETQPRKDA